MATLGIFVDRQTLSYSKKLVMLMRFRDVAESLGHRSYFIFPVELKKIAKLDALLIRSRTDPLNVSYVAARMAVMHGIPVIDNPEAIRICSDKVNMYLHLMRANVPIPRTSFWPARRSLLRTQGRTSTSLEPGRAQGAIDQLFQSGQEGAPGGGFIQTARAYLKMADELVVQEYIESEETGASGAERQVPLRQPVRSAPRVGPGAGRR